VDEPRTETKLARIEQVMTEARTGYSPSTSSVR
jgi:hypothetical protein